MTHNQKSRRRALRGADDAECLRRSASCSAYLPQNNLDDAPRIACTIRPTARTSSSTRSFPRNPNKPYDMHEVIRSVVDDG